jgi:predicted GNAT family N-acyltransferase
MSSLKLKQIVYGTPAYNQLVDLRHRILREPLGLTFTEHDLASDQQDFLLGLTSEGIVKGCLILIRYNNEWAKLKQMAIDPSLQGKGAGQMLLQEGHAIAREWGYSQMFCHARATAASFYQKNGWRTVGDQFTEVNIPHFRMEVTL